jgi:hypothetical protein
MPGFFCLHLREFDPSLPRVNRFDPERPELTLDIRLSASARRRRLYATLPCGSELLCQ